MARQPDVQLALAVLPAPLYRALTHVFAQQIADCMLVGGTALAGYYAGHRRSDDLDLFVRDASALQAAVLAVESLTEMGGTVLPSQRTPQFYDATCELRGHTFTTQVVLDAGVFDVGEGIQADDGVIVASLQTLLKQKAATLVSRCSEKDLYDLKWLFGAQPDLKIEDLIQLGTQIDGGMSAESAVISVTGTSLRRAACGFSRTQDIDAVYRDVTALKQALALAFDKLARKQPVGAVGDLIRQLRGSLPAVQ